ncbi:MAG: hypothetical protein CM15mV7_0050 [uncultured marine virus]|nr:MAG: hypothetical protein CM15mV7_0050 [uncultured marine virus]
MSYYTDNKLNIYDTNLISEELFQEVVMLPYQFTRTDNVPTRDNPNLELEGMYWTHQFYNLHPLMTLIIFKILGYKVVIINYT